MPYRSTPLSRRNFLATSAAAIGCSCLAGAALPMALPDQRRLLNKPLGKVVLEEPFGRIEQIADKTYAIVSTPFTDNGIARDRLATLSNGGLIAGDTGVLVFDAFQTPQGAAWVAQFAEKTFGRRPTHVVCSHFHMDHVGGLAGFFHDGQVPEIILSKTTADRCRNENAAWVQQPGDERFEIPSMNRWGAVFVEPTRVLKDETNPVEIDLGGRTVRIVPMKGHTGSDLVVDCDDPAVAFGGDLMWNGVFPNFSASTPSDQIKSVNNILANPKRIVVPGHGPAARADADPFNQFKGLLDHLGTHARDAHAKGQSANDAATNIAIPDSLGQWRLFNPNMHRSAIQAWYRELEG